MLEDKLRLKKGDYVVIIFVVIIIVVLLCMNLNRKQGNYVHITVDGMTKTYSLSENEVVLFVNDKQVFDASHTGITNTIVIENGQVYMKNANCPDQVCVKHKSISKHGEMIICLPNKVFVEIEGNIANEIDN
ncbi:MAG: NusG domain II-containing protein [Lachnospiraceae bacterium]|nr:NusG domain II-containing protein [Lachnospiraceae bacterium]